jgi:hypothetical protein
MEGYVGGVAGRGADAWTRWLLSKRKPQATRLSDGWALSFVPHYQVSMVLLVLVFLLFCAFGGVIVTTNLRLFLIYEALFGFCLVCSLVSLIDAWWGEVQFNDNGIGFSRNSRGSH